MNQSWHGFGRWRTSSLRGQAHRRQKRRRDRNVVPLRFETLEDRRVLDAPTNPSFELSPDMTGWSPTSSISVIRNDGFATHGAAYARLVSPTGSVSPGGSTSETYTYSSHFSAAAGDVFRVDWRTVTFGADAATARGGFVNVSTNTTIASLFSRDAVAPSGLITSQFTVPYSGTFKVYFGVRTRDANSNGDAAYQYLEVDNIRVTPASPPTNITLTNSNVAENSATNQYIGSLLTTDPDSTSHTYSLQNSAGGRFKVSGNSLLVDNGSLLNYEAATSHSITVRSTDPFGLYVDKSFTITVLNGNESPTNITLSNTTILENAGANAVVGTLGANDPEGNDGFVFSLVNGVLNNGEFNINGTQLRANGSFDYETTPSRQVRVRVADSAGNTFLKDFIISVGNVVDTLNATLPGGGNLIVEDTSSSGQHNQLSVRVSGTNVLISDTVDVFHSAPSGTALTGDRKTLIVPLGLITGSLTLRGRTGNDTLSVDFSGGNPIPAGGIAFDGGYGGDDALRIVGYSLTAADGVADVSVTHTSSDSGEVVLAGLGSMTFDEIEPLTLGGTAADLVITLPPGADSITLGDDGGTQDTNGNTPDYSALYDATGPAYSFEFTEFMNPTNSLTIRRGSALDILTVRDLVTSGMGVGLTIGVVGEEFDRVTLSGPITLASDRSLSVAAGTIDMPSSTSDVSVQGMGAILFDASKSVSMWHGASLTSDDGNIDVIARAGSSYSGFAAIYVNGATIASTGGDIQLTGNPTTTTASILGVALDNGAIVSTSGTGDIEVVGRGGDAPAGTRHGILLQNGASVLSTGGTIGTGLGTITLNGTAGAGWNGNFGVYLSGAGTKVASAEGAIHVVGRGNGSMDYNGGIILSWGALVESTDIAPIVMEGTGGLGTGNQYGIWLRDANTKVTSVTGDIHLIGQGGSSFQNYNHGVTVTSGAQITSSGNALIEVQGTAGPGSNSYGVSLDGTESRIASSGGDILISGVGGWGASSPAIRLASSSGVFSHSGGDATFVGDRMSFDGTSVIGGSSGIVSLVPRNPGTLINLGGADVAGTPNTLGLSDAELAVIYASRVVVGDANSGTITAIAPVHFPMGADAHLITGSDIVLSNTVYSSRSLALTAVNGAVMPISQGDDVSAELVSFTPGTDLAIQIDGGTANTQYSQLRAFNPIYTGASPLGDDDGDGVSNSVDNAPFHVNPDQSDSDGDAVGDVIDPYPAFASGNSTQFDLSGSDLVINGSYVPAGETFVIVNVDGNNSRTGTFNGLAEGDSVTINGIPTKISYVAGDGNNDVALISNSPPSADAGGPYTIAEGSPIQLSAGGSSDAEQSGASLAYEWDLDYDGITFHADATGIQPTLTFSDDFAPMTIAVRATDSGGLSDIATTTLAVTNVPPTVMVSGPSTVNEGSVYVLNLGSSDPGSDTISGWNITWGDGSPVEAVGGNPSSVTHVYVDGTRVHTILATATDEDGTYEASASGGNAMVSVDPSFGNSGEVRMDFFGSTADYGRHVTLLQPDGKILLAGYTQGGNANIGLARYLPAGTLDATFGVGGQVVTEFGGSETVNVARLDSMGRIVVGGSFGLARYLNDGTLDLSFGVNGRLSLFDSIVAMEFDSQQRLVVASSWRLGRFNPDGTVDQTFNGGNYVYISGSLMNVVGLAVVAGDRIAIAGSYWSNSQNDFRAARYTASGQLDATFGVGGTDGNGVVTIDYGGRNDYVRSFLRHDNGANTGLVLMGSTEPLYNSATGTSFDPAGNSRLDGDIAVVRLLPDGTLDTSFAVGSMAGAGKIQTHFGSWEYAYCGGTTVANEILVAGDFGWARYSASGVLDATVSSGSSYPGRAYPLVYWPGGVAEDANGKVVTGGYYYGSSGQGSNFAVSRHMRDGTTDTAFGTNGRVMTDFQGSTADYIRKFVVTQADGKILVAGYKSGGVSELVLGRFLPTGALDTTFGTGDADGIDGIVINASESEPRGLAVDPVTGRIVVAGWNRLWRYNADGTPDNTFGADSPTTNSAYMYTAIDSVYAVMTTPTGDILVAGSKGRSTNGQYSADFAVARFHGTSNPGLGITAGDLDTSFSAGDADGMDGAYFLDLGSSASLALRSEEYVTAIALDASGNIAAVGRSYVYNVSTPSWTNVRYADIAVLRLSGSGQLDTSFGVGSSYDTNNNVIENMNGLVLTDFGGWEYAHSTAVDTQNRILVTSDNRLLRYDSSGVLDPTFDGDGSRSTVGTAMALAIDGDGRIVTGGNTYLSRFLANGSPDMTFAPGGYLYIADRYIYQLAMDASGRIVVGGNTGSSGATGTDFWLARYLTGGLSVTVNNVAPQNATVTGPTTANETHTIALGASATDPAGIHDPLSYTWSITRNGQPFLQTSGQNISYVAPDNGSYVATMTVSDGDGGTATRMFTTTVANLAPTANADTASMGENASGISIDVLANDTDPAGAADPLVITGVNTTGTSGSVGFTASQVTYDPNQQFESLALGETVTDTFSYSISDGDGGTAMAVLTVTIVGENDGPTVGAQHGSVTVSEGASASNTGSFLDVDASDSVTITASIGVITQGAGNSGNWSWAFATTDGPTESQPVTITATDNHGASSSVVFNLIVENVAPTANADTASMGENASPISINVLANDTDPAGAADPLVITGVNTTGTLGSVGFTASQVTYDPNNQFESLALGETVTDTFSYSISDGDGGTATAVITVTINGENDGPTVGAQQHMVTVSEGSSASNTGTFLDVDASDTVTITASIGGITQDAGNSGNWSWSFATTDGPTEIQPVTITAMDDHGASSSVVFDLIVENVAPQITALSSSAEPCSGILENQTVTVAMAFVDPGTGDTHTAVIDWGDGTTSTISIGVGVRAISSDHAYAVGGVYGISVSLADDDGGMTVDSTSATLVGAGVVDRVLYVIGTSGDDRVHFEGFAQTNLRVHAGFFPEGPHRAYSVTAFDRIVVYLCGGNDHLTTAGNVSTPAYVHGGGGNDRIHFAGGPAIAVGGTGNDELSGGSSRNILIGGSGADTLRAGNQGDALVDASTQLDANVDALFGLLGMWKSNASFDSRVSAMAAALVIDESDDGVDQIFGGSGDDLIFADLDDVLNGNKKRYRLIQR